MTRELIIETLGSRGDGVARCDEGMLYIPFTLPGERVCVNVQDGRGDVLELLEASPERCEPLCRHYGTCGGCSLQHLAQVRQRLHYLASQNRALLHIDNPMGTPPGKAEQNTGTRSACGENRTAPGAGLRRDDRLYRNIEPS